MSKDVQDSKWVYIITIIMQHFLSSRKLMISKSSDKIYCLYQSYTRIWETPIEGHIQMTFLSQMSQMMYVYRGREVYRIQ